MFLTANRDARLGGVLTLQDHHLSGLIDLRNNLESLRKSARAPDEEGQAKANEGTYSSNLVGQASSTDE
jgi:hypothetical protein